MASPPFVIEDFFEVSNLISEYSRRGHRIEDLLRALQPGIPLGRRKARSEIVSILRSGRALERDLVSAVESMYLRGAGSASGSGPLERNALSRTQKTELKAIRERVAGYSEIAHTSATSSVQNITRTSKRKDPLRNARDPGHVVTAGRPGSRMNYRSYMEMVTRSETSRAFNLGAISMGLRNGVVSFEIQDGPGCGLINHDDSQKASGMIVSARDARKYIISHPNCTRRFVPRPDLTDKPPSVLSLRQRAAARAREAGAAAKASAKASAKEAVFNIAVDMAFDAEFRQFVFAGAKYAIKPFQEFAERTRAMMLRNGIDYNPMNDDEIGAMVQQWIDYALEADDLQALPVWVQGILLGKEDELTWQVFYQKAGEYDYYRELSVRAGLTHAQLNVLNQIEGSYGTFGLNRIRRAFPGDDSIGRLYAGAVRRYMDDGSLFQRGIDEIDKNVNRIGRQGARQIENYPFRRYLQNPINDLIERYLPDELGRFTIPRLGSRDVLDVFRKLDGVGLRYQKNTKFIRVQSTLTNRLRHLRTEELRSAAYNRGVANFRLVRPAQEGFGQVIRNLTRQELISAIGYEPGLLSHFTINPNGMLRFGFRFNPRDGWRLPQPRLTIVGPGDFRKLRYTGTLLRGRVIDGTRVRSINHEFSLATGRLLTLGTAGRWKLPSIPGIGVKFKTILVEANNARGALIELPLGIEIPDQVLGYSLRNFAENTELMGAFMEMRLLGFSWIRIGHIFKLSPEEIHQLIPLVRQFFNLNREEILDLVEAGTIAGGAQLGASQNRNDRQNLLRLVEDQV